MEAYENQSLDIKNIKTLPNSYEAELAILGGIFLNNDALEKVLFYLETDYFFYPRHQYIFQAMLNLNRANIPIDAITIQEELKKMGKLVESGGLEYIAKICSEVASSAQIEHYAQIVAEKAILRNIIKTASEIIKKAQSDQQDAFEVLDDAEKKIFEIAQKNYKQSYKSLYTAVKETLEYIEMLGGEKNEKAVFTGYYELDSLLGGIQSSDFVVVAARPSMGKTAFALSVARNVAVESNIPVAFFSLEMATLQLVIRMICAEARVNSHYLRSGKLSGQDAQKITKSLGKLLNAPIYIDDTPAQTILEIRAKARRLKAEKNIGLVIIDYLSLIQSPLRMESREREISAISRSLKFLAKEIETPVIALAQLNRENEKLQDKRPLLSHLRESGSIEQDADIVIFLHRPEYYKILTDKDGRSLEGIAEIIVAKHRNGPTGEVRLKFNKEFSKFENLEVFREEEAQNFASFRNNKDDLI